MRTSQLGLAGVGALLLAIAACSEELETPTSSALRNITITARDFEPEASTRTDFKITDKGAEFAWAANDTVGIFPETGAQAYFPMTSGAGTKTASFSGGGWALKDASRYAAYYPFVGSFYLNREAIPVNYTGQTQVGDASTAHLGAYDYMAAAPATPQGGNANFAFNHLGCLVQLKLTVPQATALTSVTISTKEALFAVEGTVNLMSDLVSITPTRHSSSIRLDLKEIATTADNQVVTLYLMLPPTDLSGKELTVTATHQTAQKAVATLTGKNLQAGRAYAFSATLPAVDPCTTIQVTTAGTLASLIGDSWNRITTLSVSGPLNGDDIRLIREMAGVDVNNYDTDGCLTSLDLSNAIIVSGGGAYNQTYYKTTNDEISNNMFEKTKLVSVMLPTSVHKLGSLVFYKCQSLEDVIIPNSVLEIGQSSFCGCSNLSHIILPEKIESLGISLFENCTKLEDVVLPPSLKIIEGGAFELCSRLQSIELPSTITTIGSSAFSYCSRLKSIEIPDGVKTISSYAFRSCSILESVKLPSKLVKIEDSAFDNCRALSQISLPSSVVSIGDFAFSGCQVLQNIDFPVSLQEIGNYAFSTCWSMTKVVLPDALTDIGDNAFLSCNSISELHIGKSVKSIGYNAFESVPLKTLYCYPTTPPTLYDNAFTPSATCTFYVPKGCKATYEGSGWKNYFPTATEMTE